MSIELFLYLIDRLDVVNFLAGLSAMLLIAAPMLAIYFIDNVNKDKEECREDARKLWKFIKSKWYVYFIVFFLAFILPSQKTMYLIAGAHYLKKSDIPSKVEMAINKKLNEYLDYDEKEVD